MFSVGSGAGLFERFLDLSLATQALLVFSTFNISVYLFLGAATLLRPVIVRFLQWRNWVHRTKDARRQIQKIEARALPLRKLQ